MIEKVVNVERVEDLIAVFGSFDENIRRIEDALGVNIVNRGSELKIVGVNIRRLRIKIEDDATNPTYITTIWGFGYKWGS